MQHRLTYMAQTKFVIFGRNCVIWSKLCNLVKIEFGACFDNFFEEKKLQVLDKKRGAKFITFQPKIILVPNINLLFLFLLKIWSHKSKDRCSNIMVLNVHFQVPALKYTRFDLLDQLTKLNCRINIARFAHYVPCCSFLKDDNEC